MHVYSGKASEISSLLQLVGALREGGLLDLSHSEVVISEKSFTSALSAMCLVPALPTPSHVIHHNTPAPRAKGGVYLSLLSIFPPLTRLTVCHGKEARARGKQEI